MASLKDRIASVTDEQVARCHRVTNEQTGETYYKVENSRGLVDENGEIVEYEVHFIVGKGFTCNCPSGREGFRTARVGVCQHCIWSYVAAQQFKAEQLRQEHMERLQAMGLTEVEAHNALAHQLIVDGRPADDETLVRVWGPADRRPSEEAIEACQRRYDARPFQLMR